MLKQTDAFNSCTLKAKLRQSDMQSHCVNS